MTERVDWEIVDGPSSRQGKRQATGEAMRTMLGRGWKWKLAGTAIVSLLTLAFFATLTGALVLLFAAGTVLMVAVRKVKQWLVGDRRETSPVKT